MKRRFFKLGYFTQVGDDLPPHYLRDGDAFAEIEALLCTNERHQYGGLLLNYPCASPPEVTDSEPDPVKTSVDLSFLNSNDLLVMTTRPPLDDDRGLDKRIVPRSYNSLEKALFPTLRKYFTFCNRRWLKLADHLAMQLSAAHVNRSYIEFYVNESRREEKRGGHVPRSAKYKKLYGRSPDESPPRNRTAVYLLHLQNAWKNGPAFLATFGMGGTETLLWTHLLRERYWEELKLGTPPRFVMAEMKTDKLPDCNSEDITLTYATKWDIDILLNTENLSP
jgi:hypothetical protein